MDDTTLTADGRISDGAPVKLRVGALACVWQLAGWGGFAASADTAARKLGLSLPDDFRSSQRSASLSLWRIAPDRALIGAEHRSDPPETPADIALLDLSQARVKMVLNGAGAAGLLARLTSVDTSLNAFPLDTFAQTGVRHVGVLIDRRAVDRFDVLVPRTWARWIADAMRMHLVP